MSKYKIPAPSCRSCDALNEKYYETRYCNGGKKPIRFKAKDPKRKVPKWCPKLKKPAAIRVYGFKNEDARTNWVFFTVPYDNGKGKNDVAVPHTTRYKLDFEGTIGMYAKEFYDEANAEPIETLIDFKIKAGNVIEIDDGIKPYFFYYQGFQLVRPAMFTPPETEGS